MSHPVATGVHILDENLDEGVPIAVGISPKTKIPDFTDKLNKFIFEKKEYPNMLRFTVNKSN